MTTQQTNKLIRFDPTVSTGVLIEICVILGSVFAAYSALKTDQATAKIEVEQVKADQKADRERVKDSLTEIKTDVKEVSKKLAEMNESLAVLKAKK